MKKIKSLQYNTHSIRKSSESWMCELSFSFVTAVWIWKLFHGKTRSHHFWEVFHQISDKQICLNCDKRKKHDQSLILLKKLNYLPIDKGKFREKYVLLLFLLLLLFYWYRWHILHIYLKYMCVYNIKIQYCSYCIKSSPQ